MFMKFIKKLLAICSVFIFISGILFPEKSLSVTVKKEEEMGREFMKIVLKHFELIKDPVIVKYLNQVGNRIVSTLPSKHFTYHFYIIKQNAYNAFASPAGNIFINSGLLEAIENEEELAGILAHEIAHVECRHISQKIERSSKIGLLTLAGIAAGIFLGIGGSGAAADAVVRGSVAAGTSLSLAYSREDEMQADHMGLKHLDKAGYDCAGLLAILKKIRSKQWFGSDQIPTYLTTHPASEERIVYISAWLEDHEKRVRQTSGRKQKIDSYDFEMAHTRLVALYGEKSLSLKKFEADVNKHPCLIAHYGYGLILARTGDRKGAIIHLKTALEKRAFDPFILKDLGRIYFFDGRYEEALNILKSAISIASDDPESLFFLGRSQLGLGRLNEALSTFEKLIKDNPDYNQAYYFLGKAYSKLERLTEAHYYLGIYYKNKEEFKNAAFHLKKALINMKDKNKKLKIKQMLKEIGKKSAEKQKEERFNRS